MNVMSGYLLRIICAAMVCALVESVGSDGAGKGLRKLMAGVFLALTVLAPLADVELPRLNTSQIHADADAAVREGIEQARQAKDAIISEALEAYIWNKADGLGLELTVRVTLDEQGLPKSVELSGAVSPADRQALSSCIARELGLGKEALIWNVSHQSSE